MAKFSKIEVISAMASTGMVPVFYNKDIEWLPLPRWRT